MIHWNETESMFTPNEWYVIKSRAFTSIRMHFRVEVLAEIAFEDNETPVDGDILAARRPPSKFRA